MLPDLMQFQSKLSPAARALLTAAPPQQKAELFGSWTRQAIGVLADRAAAASGQPLTEARLRQFFEKEVPESERERLLSLPADEVRGQLQRMYYLRSLAPPGTNNPPDGNAPRGPRTGTGPNKRFDNERRPGAIPPPAS